MISGKIIINTLLTPPWHMRYSLGLLIIRPKPTLKFCVK